MNILKQRRTRLYIYTVSLAVFSVGVVYGIIDNAQLAAWSGLALAVTGLAANNVNPDHEETDNG